MGLDANDAVMGAARFRTMDSEQGPHHGNGTDAADEWSDCLHSIAACGREYPEPEQFVQGFLRSD